MTKVYTTCSWEKKKGGTLDFFYYFASFKKLLLLFFFFLNYNIANMSTQTNYLFHFLFQLNSSACKHLYPYDNKYTSSHCCVLTFFF